jgi:hypothetical protein
MTSTRTKFTRPTITPFKEDTDPVTPRRGARAFRDGDAKVRGKRSDAKAGSLLEAGDDTTVGGHLMPFFDPRRNLIVELKPAVLKRILDAATARGRPVTLRLEITVHPRDAKGFVHVVGELEPSDLPPDFSSIDLEDGPLGLFDQEPE